VSLHLYLYLFTPKANLCYDTSPNVFFSIYILIKYFYIIYINLVYSFKFKNQIFPFGCIFFFTSLFDLSLLCTTISYFLLFLSQFSSLISYYFQKQIAPQQDWEVKKYFGLNNFLFWVSSFFIIFWSNMFYSYMWFFYVLGI